MCVCVFSRSLSVCVYVNKHGNCGPHLDRKQMQHLPDHFGPGPVNSVLQQVVQSCIDCAYQPKVLLGALQTHSGGGEIVRGRISSHFPCWSSFNCENSGRGLTGSTESFYANTIIVNMQECLWTFYFNNISIICCIVLLSFLNFWFKIFSLNIFRYN